MTEYFSVSMYNIQFKINTVIIVIEANTMQYYTHI